MTLAPLPLSVLDLSPVAEGRTPEDAVAATISYAQLAEELGLTRYWLAEHHAMPGIASSAPAVLIGAVAAATRRIRVGSGGVMLPNHAPLVVAEQFGLLSALHPGRIDLGLGRAPGTDQRTAAALRRSEDPLSGEDFPRQLAELVDFLVGGSAGTGGAVVAVPHATTVPPVWLLGSSGYSAQLAGHLGLPFAFAHHFSAHNTLPALELYRRSFRPSETLDEPYAAIAVQVLCGEDDDHASRLALPSLLSWVRLRQGRPSRLPTPQEAESHPWSDLEVAMVQDRLAGQALGGPETVRDALAELIGATGVQELVITTTTWDPDERAASLQRVRALLGEEPLPQGLAGTAHPLHV